MKNRGPNTRRSKIDLTGAFHRIEILDSWVHIMLDGIVYRVCKGFFGVNILPSHFQRLTDTISRMCSFECRIYLDDSFNEGGTAEEDILQCIELINLFTKYNLIINQKKCYFGQLEIPALGFIVGGNGKRMNPSKAKAITNWQPPMTGKQMASFLGVVNFNREHLPHYAHVSKLLDQCRTKGAIEWTPDLHDAFQKVKDLVIRNLSLVVRDESSQLVLCTDASSLGLGYVLCQLKPEFKNIKHENIRQEHLEIIEYGSVAISDKLAHGSATKRELAAVIFAFRKCYYYLAGTHFLLIGDHKPLVWLFTQEHTSPMLYRWVDLLLALSFTALHWKGEWNFVSDAMSRPSCTNNIKTSDIPDDDHPQIESLSIKENTENSLFNLDKPLEEEKATPETLDPIELANKAAYIRNKTIP